MKEILYNERPEDSHCIFYIGGGIIQILLSQHQLKICIICN